MTHKILIIGAGICGLATAIGLAQQGFEVAISEQAEQFEEIGAGLQLSPNAISALKYLGVYENVKAVSTPIDALQIYVNNQHITALSLQKLAQIFGAPFLSLHRASLHAVLLERAKSYPNITLHPAYALKNITQTTGSVAAEFENNQTLTAHSLIGADGVNSKTRHILFGIHAKPSGLTAKRALVDTPPTYSDVHNCVELYLSPNSHGVTYPLLHHNKRNYIWTVRNEDLEKSPHIETENGWRYWPMLTVPALPTWHKGNVLLIGDAAHATLPFAAQGACMALEDGAVLAKLCEKLAHQTDICAAFIEFERLRKPRTTAIQTLSLKNGQTYHARGGVAWLRNIMLRYFGAPIMVLRMGWVWRWVV